MKFCIDETGLHASPDPGDQAQFLETLSNLVNSCHERAFEVERSDDLFFTEISDSMELYKLLYEQIDGIDTDIQKFASAALNRCTSWQDEHNAIGTVEVKIGERISNAPSVAYAHMLAGDYQSLCMLVVGSDRSGLVDVIRQDVMRPIFFMESADNFLCFFRHVPDAENMDADRYFEHALLAFPDIHFTSDLATQAGRFSKPFEALRADVTKHLGALNDSFKDILVECSGEPRDVAATFSARCGVTASPENGNTKSDKKAWAQRKISVSGQGIYCDWHTKIHPTADRIHFYPGKPGLVEGKLIVGILHEHLKV